jgi:membrane protease YdiL (CAAX protease family)
MTKQNKIKIMVIYLIAFFSLWALAELVIFERINIFVENEILSCFIEDAIIKMLVWTLPAAIMIHYFKDAVYITLKEMFLSKVNWFQYLPIFIFFTLYILSGAILQNGNLVVSSEFGFDNVVGLLFVGITEELVFRGWLLNLTVNEGKKWLPISINAIMFLAIHFPIWIRQGVFISSFTSLGFLCILILSIIFSCTFIKSRNILVPVVLHMYWDLLVSLFF